MSNPNLPGDSTLPSSQEEIDHLIRLSSGNEKYSIEDFFRKPEKSQYKLSPDGIHYSFVAPYKRRSNIFVRKIDSPDILQITFDEDRDISGYFWANNDRIIYLKDQGGNENFQLYAINKDGTGQLDLTPFDGVRIGIVDDLEDNEEEIIIAMNKNNPQLFEPYRLNINTGRLNQLAVNDNVFEPIDSWITDHDGKLRIASKLRGGTNTVLLYRENESDEFKEIITTDFRETISPLFFDFKEAHIIYVSSNQGRDKSVITKFNLRTAEETGEIIFSHPEVDVQSLTYSKKRKVITTVQYTTGKKHIHFIDKKTEDTFQFLKDELGNYEIVPVSRNKEETQFIIRTYSDRSLGAYYHYDSTKKTLHKITEVSPWLDESDMSEMKPIHYLSRDGLKIPAYLSLPKSSNNKKLPVIIHPHGGPWVRDSWGYNPAIQLFTSRGYAVLQMNYRGSTGYGRKFWEQGFKEWGAKMQDDISDGVHYLIDEGIADPTKIAIYGGSYGGYATLAGLCFSPELYACGIDYVGVSNLLTFMNTVPPYWEPYLQMMYEMVGHPEEEKDMMIERSPAYHVDKIKAPLFVVQGANDPRVNIDESDQIVKQLRSKGVDVPYFVKYNEGHGFHNEENQFEFFKAMMGFLAKHLSAM